MVVNLCIRFNLMHLFFFLKIYASKWISSVCTCTFVFQRKNISMHRLYLCIFFSKCTNAFRWNSLGFTCFYFEKKQMHKWIRCIEIFFIWKTSKKYISNRPYMSYRLEPNTLRYDLISFHTACSQTRWFWIFILNLLLFGISEFVFFISQHKNQNILIKKTLYVSNSTNNYMQKIIAQGKKKFR